MKDMGLEHMQTSMLDQKRSLQELSAGIHNIKSMRSEVIVSLERLKSDIENHMASIKTEGETIWVHSIWLFIDYVRWLTWTYKD